MQAMMRNMPANMSPDMMSAAMSQMKNMKPEDWEAARAQMAGMDPEQLSRQAAAAQAQLGARQQYVLTVSSHGVGRVRRAAACDGAVCPAAEAWSG